MENNKDKEKKILKLTFNQPVDSKKETSTAAQEEPLKTPQRPFSEVPTKTGPGPKIIDQHASNTYVNSRLEQLKSRKAAFIPRTTNIFEKKEIQSKPETQDKRLAPKSSTEKPAFETRTFKRPVFKPILTEATVKKTFNNPDKKAAKPDPKSVLSKNKKLKIFKNNDSSFISHNFIGKVDNLNFESDPRKKTRRIKKVVAPNFNHIKEITLSKPLTIKEFASQLSIKQDQLAAQIKKMHIELTEAPMEIDLLQLIVEEFGVKVIRQDEEKKQEFEIQKIVLNQSAKPKIPVICIVGHIDHGKTTLLDTIKKTNVAAKEIGGITQSIGAYTIEYNKHNLTFIDTPGHSAFDSMRFNSLYSSDFAILIISSVDGIQPQTVQSIKDLKAQKTPFLVALTKCDLYNNANMSKKIKENITQYDVICEEFGGDVKFIEISATTKKNIDLLIETLIAETSKLNLERNYDKSNVQATVIEASLNSKIGIVTSVIINNGTLSVGDIAMCDMSFCKIKSLINDKNKAIKEATPGMCAQILGFNEILSPGQIVSITDSIKTAESTISYRKSIIIESETKKTQNTNLFLKKSIPSINVIIKANSIGALEALNSCLINLNTNSSMVVIVNKSVGAIKDSDIDLAKISKSIIVSFGLQTQGVDQIKKLHNIEIIQDDIIYKIIETIEEKLKGIIERKQIEVLQGVLKIQQLFSSSKLGNIAGCIVKQGTISKNLIAKVYRKEKLLGITKIKNLKRNKDDVNEVKNGFECGVLLLDNSINFKEHDEIQCFKLEFDE